MPMTGTRRSPRTKEQVLDRMLAQDFSGNIRDLGGPSGTMVERVKPNALALTFSDTGNKYFLTVHKPRPVKKNAARLGGGDNDAESEDTGSTKSRKPKTTRGRGATKRKAR